MKEVKRMLKSVEALEFALGFIVLMAVIASVAFLSGCTTGPDGIYIDETIWVYATNRIDRAIDKHSTSATTDGGRVGDDRAHKEASDGNMGTPSVDASKPVVADSFVADWRYGGFNGSKAKEDSRCRIGAPKITKEKVSWKWETKIPADWKRGSTSKGPMVISAAFYWDETANKWVGGKIDWCDEARTSRATEKIYGGYNGWKSDGWDRAKRRAFCVVSADGKLRSNVIED